MVMASSLYGLTPSLAGLSPVSGENAHHQTVGRQGRRGGKSKLVSSSRGGAVLLRHTPIGVFIDMVENNNPSRTSSLTGSPRPSGLKRLSWTPLVESRCFLRLAADLAQSLDVQGDYEVVKAALKCPVLNCTNYLSPPIRQCQNGHSFCIICQNSKCTTCGENFIRTRNYLLELITSTILLQCGHEKAGCPFRFPRTLKLKHYRECLFLKIKCFYSPCEWTGRHEEIWDHMSKVHENLTSLDIINSFTIKINDSKTHDQPLLIRIGDSLFLAKVMYDPYNNRLSGLVQIVSLDDPELYKYEFHVVNMTLHSQFDFLYCSKVHAIEEKISSIIENEKCFIIPTNIISTFFKNPDAAINIKLTIKYSGADRANTHDDTLNKIL
ncbi:E3 ubiquitin-protein ligase SIAH1B [Anabrus simplex]|uniref:E3 ubiquitin-protein ligase SIAH1B n=1 Tax=Anabrus simplex TaxID=316456 RepID=UPI0035A3A531